MYRVEEGGSCDKEEQAVDRGIRQEGAWEEEGLRWGLGSVMALLEGLIG